MADDVTIRVGSTMGSRTGFTGAERDLGDLGDAAQDVTAELRQLADVEVEPTITIPTDEVDEGIGEIRAELRQLAGTDAEVTVTATADTAEIGQAETELKGLDGEKAEVKVDAQADTSKIGDAERELKSVDGEKATMSVDVDEKGTSGKLQGLGGKLKGAATSLGQGVGQAIGSALTDAVSEAIGGALEKETSKATLQAKFAGDPEAQKQAGEVAGQLWATGYGDSLDQVNESVFAVITSSRAMRDASSQDIADVTGQALTLSQVWGTDVTESMRSVGQLMNTGLVPDATSGLALIDQAFRQLGPAADDTLDTVTEYSTQFRQLGLDGPQAFNLLKQAVDAGARDTDTAADALKEFTLIAQSMPDTAASGFKELGLSAKQMQADINAGGDKATSALDKTLDRLRAVKNPTDQARIATELFGTKAEDLQDSLLALDPTPAQNSFLSLGDTFKEVNDTMSATTQNHIDQVQRGTQAVITGMTDQQQATEGAVTVAVGSIGILDNMFGIMGDTAVDQSQRAGDSINNGIGDGVQNAATKAATLPGRVGQALMGMFGQGSAAGRDLANGFRDGIQAQVQAIADAARAAALRAVAAIRSAIGAHSPARATIELGQNFGQGFEGGIDDWTDRIIGSASDLGTSAADALRGTAVAPGMRAGSGGQVAGGQAGAGAAGGGPAQSFELVFAGNTDSAFASAFMNLVRTGKIQLRATT